MAENRKLRLKARAIIVFSVVVLLGVAAGLMFSPYFNVHEVICEGADRVDETEIIEASQIKTEKNIFLQSTSDIRKKIEKLPMVENVEVRRVFPDKIKIIVKERVPGAYVFANGALALIDTSGRVLQIVSDGNVDAIVKANTPEKPPEKEDENKQENNNDKENNNTDKEENPEATSSEGQGTQEDNGSDAEADTAEEPSPTEPVIDESLHSAPLIVGIELSKADEGKMSDCKDKEKFRVVMELLVNLEKADLLRRATYIDVASISDIVIVIENRLEILYGTPDNSEYRCAFLAKVINEKISATEHIRMDYRTNDIHVSQPEDGKARMLPKPSPEPTEDAETDEENSEAEEEEE